MATTHYSAQVRSRLSRIKNAVSDSTWVHEEFSSYPEETARGLNDCMRAFERRIQELAREVRRK